MFRWFVLLTLCLEQNSCIPVETKERLPRSIPNDQKKKKSYHSGSFDDFFWCPVETSTRMVLPKDAFWPEGRASDFMEFHFKYPSSFNYQEVPYSVNSSYLLKFKKTKESYYYERRFHEDNKLDPSEPDFISITNSWKYYGGFEVDYNTAKKLTQPSPPNGLKLLESIYRRYLITQEFNYNTFQILLWRIEGELSTHVRKSDNSNFVMSEYATFTFPLKLPSRYPDGFFYNSQELKRLHGIL